MAGDADEWTCPGAALATCGTAEEASAAAGPGTYVDAPRPAASAFVVRASVVGRVARDGAGRVSVSTNAAPEPVPLVGDEVTCRVLRVTPKVADVQILVVGERPLRGAGFKGTLRKENVRSFEVDQLDLYECFRQGDVVRAGVAALGGARSYELTTADNRYGVVHAVSAVSGEPLVPVSWEAMRDPVSCIEERRKVADLRRAPSVVSP